VGLHELAAQLEFTAILLHPTPALPYYTEGRKPADGTLLMVTATIAFL
jgi:hypothetical protein